MALRSFGQRLGAAAASRTRSRSLATITVDLNYQEPHATLATGRYINQEDKGDVVDAFEARSCAMRDGRALEEPATLESMGFALEVHPTAVGDFRDDGEVVANYYDEMRDLVKRASGASRVFVFDHTIRESGNTNLNAAAGGAAAPVPRVHCDYTHDGAPRRLLQLGDAGIFSHLKGRDLTADEVAALAAGRFAFINVWRSIDPDRPVARNPLAVCDENSIDDDDKFLYELRFPDRTGENYSLKHSDAHAWYYYPDMTADECLIFKVFDKKPDGPRFVFHTAFDDPRTTDASPPRKSIEIRTIAFYDDKPTFFDMRHSNNAARVRLWLRLVDPDIANNVASTWVTYDDLQSEDYAKVNPLRKCPALVRADGGTVFESDVILKYLEDKYGRNDAMTPATPEDRQLMNLMIRCHDLYIASPNCTAEGFSHSQGAMYLSAAWHGARRSVDVASREAKIAEIWKQLAWLEANAAGPFLVGAEPSLADLTWFPTCVFMEFMLPRVFAWADPFDGAGPTPFPKLAAWYAQCRAVGAFEETRAEIWDYWVDMEKQGQFEPIKAELAANPDRKWTYP